MVIRIILLALWLSGCATLFDDANFPASAYEGGLADKIHYETYLEFIYLGKHNDTRYQGNCLQAASAQYDWLIDEGYHPELITVHPYGSTTDHIVVLNDGMISDNNFAERYPLDELIRHGKYEPLIARR